MAWIMQNKLIFIVAIIVIAGGVWYGLGQSGTPAPLLTTTTVDGGPAAVQNADQEIIGTLLALRAVTLSGSIFSDPSFMSLQDFGTTIVAEPVGRDNPFAPLGAPTTPSQPTTQRTGAQGNTGAQAPANSTEPTFTPRTR